eukprot:CAMPEP_0181292614 /NCGR_PEP_ID=MMETSP1101-20121128/2604_1 /TAXON_ID=46948 /ORGANISM="Rhodomonas abbreviata, Strain Caron Lab Isolate" /LENGTH=433 /DNA_ID=CAMNT_0023397103 /DNA_START=73 /DNA_END=1374 /DNA_ORIENTATION=+
MRMGGVHFVMLSTVFMGLCGDGAALSAKKMAHQLCSSESRSGQVAAFLAGPSCPTNLFGLQGFLPYCPKRPSHFQLVNRPTRWFAARNRVLPLVAMDAEDGTTKGPRESAMQEKLQKWREQAEVVRLEDPSSFVSRAAAAKLPRNFRANDTGSRASALQRMWELKEIERRQEIASDLEKMRHLENPSLAEDRKKAKEAAIADLKLFVAKLPQGPSIDEIEKRALELRSIESITNKLEQWRADAREQEDEVAVGRIFLKVIFAVLNEVAKFLGFITGKQGTQLEDLEPIRTRPAVRPTVSPVPPDKDMGELLQRLRSRWQTVSPNDHMPLAEAHAKMEALVAVDDVVGIKTLLNSLLDAPTVYNSLLGYGDDPAFTPPLQVAAASGQANAAQALLRAGSRPGRAAEAAREGGHAAVADMIAAVDERSEEQGGAE